MASNLYEQELFEFLKIPSVSAQTPHHGDCLRAAEFTRRALAERGFAAEIRPTGKSAGALPTVVARWEGDLPKNAPTLLVYGHYDVQPPEPLELWTTPAFSPTVRDGKVYARGATDNKGQIFALMCGLGEALKKSGRLPMRVIFLVEGEEEIGSPNLEAFVKAHRDELRAATVLISDSPQLGPGQPAICYGLKGLTYFELKVYGPRRDLHSGSFGGLVQNPGMALAKMLASLTDAEGRVAIRGFYDDVVPLSVEERQLLSALPYDERAVKKDLGVEAFFGDPAYTPLERRFARPTCDVHGLSGGYQGEGAKTVIPAVASAKFGFRLVADQTPEKVEKLLRAHLQAATPPGCRWAMESFHPSNPVLVDRYHPYMQAAQAAIAKSFGKSPVFIREGGSIPVVSTFQRELNALALLIGLGLPTDGAHAPDEHFTLADFHRGIAMAAALPAELVKVL